MEKNFQELKQTYITLEELENIIKPVDYMDLVQKVNRFIEDGIIAQVGSKRNTNGRIPFLYMKYRIIKDKEKDIELEREIKHLAPEFKIEKYLSNKNLYKSQRDEIKKLDNFFKTDKEKLKVQLSKNERAYQIWKYEKMLDTQVGKSILRVNNLEEILNFYLTPEPFFDYILNQKENMTILIIENKDTWYTLRKIARNN